MGEPDRGGEGVVWQEFAFAPAILGSLFLLFTMRPFLLHRRRDHFLIWRGIAIFCWGMAYLLEARGELPYQTGSLVLLCLCYLFFLYALYAFPQPSQLYVARWKKYLDVLILLLLCTTLLCGALVNPAERAWYAGRLYLQGGLFLVATGGLMFAALPREDRGKRRLFSSILCLLVISLTPLLPNWLISILMAACLGGMVFEQISSAERSTQAAVPEKTVDVSRQLQFFMRDENVSSLLLMAGIVAMLYPPGNDPAYLLGMGGYLALLLVRWLLAICSNRTFYREQAGISQRGSDQQEEDMEVSLRHNEKLARLIEMKQHMEKLLVASNEHSMRAIHYENLHRMIEEIVNVWYDTLPGITFLRVSLQSETGTSYYEVVRSENEYYVAPSYVNVTVRLKVSENTDTLLSPRYVVVEAMKDVPVTKEEKPFFDLLAIHVRGLIQRCLHDQQSLELRLMEQEMELASRIQFTLIPRERLILPAAEAKAVYIPATYVGGDYVDYLVVDDRYSCYLVADISGHGLPASLLTAGIRSAFRAVIQTCISPDEILSRLNRLLYEDLLRTRSFVTMCVVVLDQSAGVLKMSRAGHPAPLYLSKSRQMVLECGRGVGLGLFEDACYPLDEWHIEEQAMLLLYTDGLTDLGRRKRALTPEDWLKRWADATVRAGDRFDAIAAVEQSIWQQARQLEQQDDISVLILELKRAFRFEKGENDVVSVRSMS